MTEEPDEGNLHVRVCGGSAGQPVLLPGSPYGLNSLLYRQVAKGIGAFSEEPLAPSGVNENSADPDFEKEYWLRA